MLTKADALTPSYVVVYEEGTSKNVMAVKWGHGTEIYCDAIGFLMRKRACLLPIFMNAHRWEQSKLASSQAGALTRNQAIWFTAFRIVYVLLLFKPLGWGVLLWQLRETVGKTKGLLRFCSAQAILPEDKAGLRGIAQYWGAGMEVRKGRRRYAFLSARTTF